MSSNLHIFGIRHHGPGSARSLLHALDRLRPDVILVEGPPDAQDVLPLAAAQDMKPPVAILLYVPDDPRRAVYYPFASFSPEWQAIQFGLRHKIPVRFMDLPQAHRLANEPPAASRPPEAPPATTPTQPVIPAEMPNPEQPVNENPSDADVRRDPLGAIAQAAGYNDGERWWEHMVEHRQDDTDLFAAVLEMMTALRENAPVAEEPRDLQREAYMRQTIRAAEKEGFSNIAVVCGAWHGPALAKMPPAKEDAAILKGLPKTKISATWVPWTYGRLTYASGYGAGIRSPGWYEHLWLSGVNDSGPLSRGTEGGGIGAAHTTRSTVRWMTRVARLLRAEDLDASSASVIESVRLAESLAAMRSRPLPGLPELNEAAQTVFCFGSDVPMRLIGEKLVVGNRLGAVPDETPAVPLQQDVQREQKRLRLQAEADHRDLDLDLRKPNDLDRSRLLHRLDLLGIGWGQVQRQGGGKGTFHELWRVQWEPEFAVGLIEAGVWGNTVADAATAKAHDQAAKAHELPALTALLDAALLADLPDAVADVMRRVEAEAAVASDVAHLMAALPPLANVLRYGNVRKTDTAAVAHVIDGLVARICIGLPPATASLNDEAAAMMFRHLLAVNAAIALLQNESHAAAWQSTLKLLADREGLHGLLAGRACRLLLDAAVFTTDQTATRMSLALSVAVDPSHAAAWVEGFLQGSGLLLLHDEPLWAVIDEWVSGLTEDVFTQVLPLLRRTFSTFAAPERKQMGQRVKKGVTGTMPSRATGALEVDPTRAEATLPLLRQLLGIGSIGGSSSISPRVNTPGADVDL